MQFLKAVSLSLVAVAAISFTACKESPTSPKSQTSAEIRADLQAMANKVKYLSMQSPGANTGTVELAKRQAANGDVAAEPNTQCDEQAITYEDWESDEAGGMTSYHDTTARYTAADQLICSINEDVAYMITKSRSENALLVSHFTTRSTSTGNFTKGKISHTGQGTIHYKDGYLITVTAIDIVIDSEKWVFDQYEMNLALEKGYAVILKLAPGIDLMSEVEPNPDDVAVSGPITKDGMVVGYFEVLVDERVIIRDADKVVIESHGG